MPDKFLTQSIKTIRDRVSLMEGESAHPDLIVNPNEFAPVKNGLVRINYVDPLNFATLVDRVPEGELLLVDEQEDLSVTGFKEGKVIENRAQEFGKYVNITPSEIKQYAQKMIVGNTLLSFAETEEQAKAFLVKKAFVQLQQEMATTVGKHIYGALFGQINSKRKTGASKPVTFPFVDFLAASTGWTDANAPIIDNMQTIINAMLGWNPPRRMADAKTLMSSQVVQTLLKNKQVHGIYSALFGQNIVSLLEKNINNGNLQDYFGSIVTGDDIYYSGGVAQRYAPANKIVIAPNTTRSPIIQVYIAPTGLDPKYRNSSLGTGGSTHVYDGTIDQNTSTAKIGSLTAGLRAKIAVVMAPYMQTGIFEVF